MPFEHAPVPRLGMTLAALVASSPVPTSTVPAIVVKPMFQVSPEGTTLIVDQFPDPQRKRYLLFKESCSRCHSLRWPISALVKGRTPVTNSVFEDEELSDYVIRMMRKRGSGIDKETARELIIFLRFARQLAREAQR